jgi:hypothetical protein
MARQCPCIFLQIKQLQNFESHQSRLILRWRGQLVGITFCRKLNHDQVEQLEGA